MGSGSSRKIKDLPVIKPPKLRQEKGRGNGSGAGGAPEAMQKLEIKNCPSVLKVDLPTNAKLKVGMEVYLAQRGRDLKLIYAGHEIAQVPARQEVLLSGCLNYGFRYRGKLKSEAGRLYAELLRST